jgi:hypothetical protein
VAAPCGFLLEITPQNKDAALKLFREDSAPGTISRFSGFRVRGLSDLGFLSEFTHLRYLEIWQNEPIETLQLKPLDNLRGLRLECPQNGIDFASLPHLEIFVGYWHGNNTNLEQCRKLRHLRTWKFQPRSGDLSQFSKVTRLETLSLVLTSLTSLSGIEFMEDLRYLHIAHAPKLSSLNALEYGQTDLRELELDKLKALNSYEPIARILRLRKLMLSDCAPMPDLRWIAPLSRLDFFSFVGTNVADGDLSPLLQLPELRYVGTLDKRHYSHRSDDLNKLLKGRLLENEILKSPLPG